VYLQEGERIHGVVEYDTAQVCPNGHVANAETIQAPEFNKDYCEECGKKTITRCPNCDQPIRGRIMFSIGMAGFKPPAYCRFCGEAFPWTALRLEAARELALDSESLNAEERQELVETLPALLSDVPKTHAAAAKFKRLATKAGKETAGALRDILVDIASETAKKIIWPS
jgi:hypothetical protein